jgi:ABC-type transport system involved in multi-copper enzyme maturation permease subunit
MTEKLQIANKPAVKSKRILRRLFGLLRYVVPLGLLRSPIFVKEMRGAFRKRRFFLAHTICLSAVSISILLGVFYWSIEHKESVRPDEVGQKLFNMFVIVQFLIVYMVFPSFGCTTITEERVNKSFDLLITSNLKPFEIVLGKFMSTYIYSSVFIFATVPLVCISFLFGGVTMMRIVNTYLILLVFSFMLTVFSIFVSSIASTTSKSTIATYGFLVLFGVVGYFFLGAILDALMPAAATAAAAEAESKMSIMERLQNFATQSKLDSTNQFFLVLYVFFAFAGFLGLFFILASNRLKPPAYNRSTSLRVLLIVFTLVVLAAALFHYSYNEQRLVPTYEQAKAAEAKPESEGSDSKDTDPGKSGEDGAGAEEAKDEKKEPELVETFKPRFTGNDKVGWSAMFYVFAAIIALVGTLTFAGEERRASLRIQHRLRRSFSGWRFPLRIFAPGAPSGAVFSVLFAIILFGALTLFFMTLGGIAGVDRPVNNADDVPVYRGFYSLFYMSGAWLTFIFFTAMLSIYLATTRLTPLMVRLASVFIVAALTLFPLILFAFNNRANIYTGYFMSPILFSFSAWQLPSTMRESDVPLITWGSPVFLYSIVFYTALGIILMVLAARRIDRSGGRFPLAEFINDNTK